MVILITGAAGTMGKSFVRYLHKEHTVIAIDQNEWAVAELKAECPEVTVLLEDYDTWQFHQQPVDVVIHCAAYKHVNLGEENPHSFITNNVTKTGKLFEEAHKWGVKILFISTDKAVEPISVYGFTKALGERLCWQYEGQVARLGNILHSSGSVIPVWEKAITEQQPIKITDERMSRYLIDDIEAVTQIWGGFLQGHKLIVPEMGTPKRLMDILTEVLARHGMDAVAYKPGVEMIGLRPGEKLEEKLRWDHEDV